ncbi:hypothetical protein [Streptomyces violascens]|uniref:hypothetical protein n=1 Tax=Streptomyces violascens TaxID=67381 RepID=UPI00368A429F
MALGPGPRPLLKYRRADAVPKEAFADAFAAYEKQPRTGSLSLPPFGWTALT